ncbi:MAG TPA: VOC family protein [Thermoleophilaceae bacterium]|nr:VOC family protein [Thermoleophilaceae bacterium]
MAGDEAHGGAPGEQTGESGARGPGSGEPRRLRIVGLHHLTLICSSLDRSVAFYRDVLGMSLVKQTHNIDDPEARHFYFGDPEGAAGTLVSLMEYPQMEPARAGTGATHHFALAVGSEDELHGWHAYLGSRGVPCTEVLDRTYSRSLYLRDPDGHVVELASIGPGFAVE